jgi:hypothetical protein
LSSKFRVGLDGVGEREKKRGKEKKGQREEKEKAQWIVT